MARYRSKFIYGFFNLITRRKGRKCEAIKTRCERKRKSPKMGSEFYLLRLRGASASDRGRVFRFSFCTKGGKKVSPANRQQLKQIRFAKLKDEGIQQSPTTAPLPGDANRTEFEADSRHFREILWCFSRPAICMFNGTRGCRA